MACLSHTNAQLSESTSVLARYWNEVERIAAPPSICPAVKPVQKYLSSLVGDHQMPSMTAGEQEESFSSVFLIDNHRGGTEPPMCGSGQDEGEFCARQSQ